MNQLIAKCIQWALKPSYLQVVLWTIIGLNIAVIAMFSLAWGMISFVSWELIPFKYNLELLRFVTVLGFIFGNLFYLGMSSKNNDYF